jgi:hypothetical protein
MTVRAEEVTLFSFRAHLLVGTTEIGQAKSLRGSVSMVELKGFEACRVTALDTFAPVRFHKFTFAIPTALSERSPKLVASTVTSCTVDIFRGRQRASRGVVTPKR